MNYIRNKDMIIYLLGLSGIVLALAFMISPNNNSMVLAQQNMMSSNTLQQNPYSMTGSLGAQNQSWTGSISLFSPIIDAFKSKIHTTLNDATTNAINAVSGGGAGSNASAGAVAAFIHPENGFLVYDVFVLDSSNNIHKVIVDPGNGKVLSNQQMSMMPPPPQASPLARGMMMSSNFPPHDMMMMMRHGTPMDSPGMGVMGARHNGWP
jgi:hypothetical protein